MISFVLIDSSNNLPSLVLSDEIDQINQVLTSSCSLIDFVLDLTLWSCTDNISLLEVSTGGREFVTLCGSELGSDWMTGGSVGGAC